MQWSLFLPLDYLRKPTCFCEVYCTNEAKFITEKLEFTCSPFTLKIVDLHLTKKSHYGLCNTCEKRCATQQ